MFVRRAAKRPTTKAAATTTPTMVAITPDPKPTDPFLPFVSLFDCELSESRFAGIAGSTGDGGGLGEVSGEAVGDTAWLACGAALGGAGGVLLGVSLGISLGPSLGASLGTVVGELVGIEKLNPNDGGMEPYISPSNARASSWNISAKSFDSFCCCCCCCCCKDLPVRRRPRADAASVDRTDALSTARQARLRVVEVMMRYLKMVLIVC